MSKDRRAKLPIMIASVILALFLWVFVQVSTEPTMRSKRSVDLEASNLEATTFAVQEKLPKVDLSLEGTNEQVTQFDAAKISAFVDLTYAVPGTRSYPVQITAPPGLAKISVRPKQVKLTLEMITNKELPVSIETTGLLQASNLVYSPATIQPEKVMVKGPQAEVEEVAKVRALLDLSKVRPGNSYSLRLEALNKLGKPLSRVKIEPEEVLATPALSPAPEQKMLLVVPRFRGQPPFGYHVTRVTVMPNQIPARGRSELVAQVTTIETSPIDLSNMKGSQTVTAILIQPTSVRLMKQTVAVRIEMEKEVSEVTVTPPPTPTTPPAPTGP